MRGAAAVVVVLVAANGCGLEVDEAAREGPGSGFSTVIRWVSSVPSRFQGGYCHESGVECMFPAARQSAFERLRAQVRRIVLFVRGALWLQVALHVGPRQTHASSRLSDKATAVGSISIHTEMCMWHGTQWTEASSTRLGIRDRTIQGQNASYGTVPARCFECVDFVFLFLFQSLLLPRGLLAGLAGLWTPISRHTWHAVQSRDGRRQPGDVNHPGNGGRGGVRGGETKQNTGDKTTGEPAIRKQEVANVDLLSLA